MPAHPKASAFIVMVPWPLGYVKLGQLDSVVYSTSAVGVPDALFPLPRYGPFVLSAQTFSGHCRFEWISKKSLGQASEVS